MMTTCIISSFTSCADAISSPVFPKPERARANAMSRPAISSHDFAWAPDVSTRAHLVLARTKKAIEQ